MEIQASKARKKSNFRRDAPTHSIWPSRKVRDALYRVVLNGSP